MQGIGGQGRTKKERLKKHQDKMIENDGGLEGILDATKVIYMRVQWLDHCRRAYMYESPIATLSYQP